MCKAKRIWGCGQHPGCPQVIDSPRDPLAIRPGKFTAEMTRRRQTQLVADMFQQLAYRLQVTEKQPLASAKDQCLKEGENSIRRQRLTRFEQAGAGFKQDNPQACWAKAGKEPHTPPSAPWRKGGIKTGKIIHTQFHIRENSEAIVRA